MSTQSTFNGIKLEFVAYTIALVGMMFMFNSCQKSNKPVSTLTAGNTTTQIENMTALQNQPQTDVVKVLGLQKSADGKSASVMFSKHELIFLVTDASQIAQLEAYQNSGVPLKIVFDPWQASVLKICEVSLTEKNNFYTRQIVQNNSQAILSSELNSDESLNRIAEMGIINTTTPGLTAVVPDMATAQMMFNYFASQCCQNPGPYSIDHCITFQYCADGCYARAHKMCYFINNEYHYATQKVFSFALSGLSLSVKAEKWCNRCINWWYHVAPLVTINTPKGPRPYVFDPSMFDQPVPLNTWLNAQKNPACSSTPGVTKINIQPTASYSPADYSGNTFDTDPTYSSTNSTLVSYHYLHTCP